MAPDREQQLMLRGGQPRLSRLLLAPAQKPAKTGPQLQEVLEVSLIEAHLAAAGRCADPSGRVQVQSLVAPSAAPPPRNVGRSGPGWAAHFRDPPGSGVLAHQRWDRS